uniref:Putative secreted protein n=1 Tax=Anopheles darlingi TaxID=43151 RepID=A0A2M4DPE3_ANODA
MIVNARHFVVDLVPDARHHWYLFVRILALLLLIFEKCFAKPTNRIGVGLPLHILLNHRQGRHYVAQDRFDIRHDVHVGRGKCANGIH